MRHIERVEKMVCGIWTVRKGEETERIYEKGLHAHVEVRSTYCNFTESARSDWGHQSTHLAIPQLANDATESRGKGQCACEKKEIEVITL